MSTDSLMSEAVESARVICARQLELRPRTYHELESVLRRKGIPDDAAETVLARFTEIGMIDDAAFARAWVESRHSTHHLGRRALAFELRRKGVDQHHIADALSSVNTASERSAAYEIAERKLRAFPDDLSAAVAFRRLAGLLGRKGFPPDVSREVIRAVMEVDGED